MISNSSAIDGFLIHGTVCAQGIAMCLANGFLLLAILLKRSLRERKELMIIAGMAASDIIYGLGAIQISIYRFYILAQGNQNDPSSQWNCLSLSIAINMGLQLTSVMTVILSIDRLLCVACPMKYRNLDGQYATLLLALVALFGILSFLGMLLSTFFNASSHDQNITNMCLPPFPNFYYLYQMSLITITSCTSVIIYIGVFVAVRRKMRQISPNTVSNDHNSVILQRRLTVTLGIISVSTFLFFIIPFAIITVYTSMNLVMPQAALLGTISRFSTILNVAIFVYRQKEVQREIWELLICKKMSRRSQSPSPE